MGNRSTAIAFLAFFSLVLGTSAVAGEDTTRKQSVEIQYHRDLEEGVALLRKKEYARALGRFKDARKLNAEGPQAYYWMALTFSELKNYGPAVDNAEKATILDEKMADAWLLWGQSLLYMHEWEAAKEKLEKAHRMAPDNPLVAFNIGRCYYHGFNNETMALRFFKAALETKPKTDIPNHRQIKQDARLYAGTCYLAKNIPLAAKRSFEAILAENRTHAEAHFRLGLVHRTTQDFAEAVKSLQTAIHHNPKHYEAHLHLGHIYLQDLPNPNLAYAHLNKFYKIAPKEHPWRARIYRYYDKKREEAAEKRRHEEKTAKSRKHSSAARSEESRSRTDRRRPRVENPPPPPPID